MAETLRDLVVSLSLQTDNFTRNIKSVNKQIAEAESQFKLAASGVEGFERSATGLATQLSTLERRLSLTNEAGKRYSTTASKLTNLKNKALLFGQQIGDDLNPTIQSLIEGADNLLSKFLQMDEAQRKQIIQYAAIAAAIGPSWSRHWSGTQRCGGTGRGGCKTDP